MSLQRVSSIETFTTIPTNGSRPRRTSDASTRARKLTFNPLPQRWDPPTTLDQLAAVGAFKVPKWKRLHKLAHDSLSSQPLTLFSVQVIVGVASCFFGAGIVFGYAAIKPVLRAEGAYRRICAAQNGSPDAVDTCADMHLNLMFTVAAVATNVAALPVRAILDHLGPRVCGLLGSLSLATGALLMAFENRLEFDALLLGYFCLALGGPFTYISSFQLSNAFPRRSGFILALLTGAFDASSALFLAYRIVYEKTDGAFGHRRFFLGYLLVPAAIALLQMTLMPSQSYKTVGELVEEIEAPIHAVAEPAPYDRVDEETALLQEEERRHRADVIEGIQNLLGSSKADAQTEREEHVNKLSGVWGVMHGYTAWEQIKSPWFILICLFTIIQMTRINFFVATVRSQYESLLGSHEGAVPLNNFFDVALPLGGILAVPFIGTVLDHTSTPTVLAALVFFATAIGVLGVIPRSPPGRLRQRHPVFGFETFGTVYGTVIALSGVLNFAQEGLDWLFERRFGGDPVPVNVLLLLLGLAVGVTLVGFVCSKARLIARQRVPEGETP
ncbi:hypothetical protein MYCTH_2106347 [Thermothelomyces thermophilus ATCC 42464]|uniref:Major facilitator superfamily (MFS) profile domain-containing protein n=1 Tax=Thermothelomyces thermophilus (strain ATCC 42464 / BCRC 31852 / DSM 1799) TaxID=573729 RepID=G2Q354_THET4|nr:uncharacterized protein MYCTH_2106347 [Thermothelomyces thermophilus ATCC 42464]AEO53517.1 hypothetical protein MYCTH_2106347 [Thermothelomyces thermophilus ATCC 42464]